MPSSTASAKALSLTPDHALTPEQVTAVAREGLQLTIAPAARTAMKASRAIVESCLTDGRAHYGINTGFGSLAKQRISNDSLAALQRNLVRSHTAGVGAPLPVDVTRAMMLCLAASLSRGLSGVRPQVVELLVGMLNAGITPVVPSIGSVGASGDLAPLASVALAMIGEGSCSVSPASRGSRGRTKSPVIMSSSQALAKAGLKPITLGAKEGLAMINGTHLMCGWGSMLVADAMGPLWSAATVTLAMSIDACRASHSYLDERLYGARQHAMAGLVAEAVRDRLAGGQIAQSHLKDDPRVQDPYSLRAAPTVLGAAFDSIATASDAIEDELAAVTDNPLVFPKGWWDSASKQAIISGANFHGMPLAIPLDTLAIAFCHIAGISERRSYLMTGAFEPESHLKPFLAPKPGLQSGLMIAQYTAAACVNEMITLATPASVSNITTCAGMEDYNSYGPRGAAKAARSLELCRHVIAIEMLIAAAGLDLHRPLKSGKGVERAHAIVRSHVKPMGDDRPLTADIEALSAAIARGEFIET